MANDDRSAADIDIEFPLVNFGGGAGGDQNAKQAMFDLTHEIYSPFNGCDNWQVFIFCCTYGFGKKKIRKPVPGKGTLPTTAFRGNTRDVMRAIAIAETKDLRVIDNQELELKVVELKKELIKLNAQIATGSNPKNPKQVRDIKKTVAKILTIKRERLKEKTK